MGPGPGRVWVWHLCLIPALWAVLGHCYKLYEPEVMDKDEQDKRLALWIDGHVIEQFVGQPMDIYVIQDGYVVPYLLDAFYDTQLPILPPEVRLVELTWMAQDDVYKYKFTDLRSLDPHTLYNPLLSIPQYGIVPKYASVFQMTIPCTGKVTGIASMYIVLHIENSRGRPVPGSPLKLHLRKRCIAFESKTMCEDECENGGTCNERGRCDCPPGYYGSRCHLAVCFPECVNNGSCVRPGKCACHEGYTGDRCENVVCHTPCQNFGTCVAPELCECPYGFYGDHCEFATGHCEPYCINGGTCSRENTCNCLPGYGGQFCQKPTCDQWCGVHGRCVAVNECQCHRGWRGRFCNKTVKNIRNLREPHRKKRRKQYKKNRYGRESRTERDKRKDNKKRRTPNC